MVSDFKHRIKQRHTYYKVQRTSGGRAPPRSSVQFPMPALSSLAHAEDVDAARAELHGQVARAPRKLHREVCLSPPTTF